MPFNINVLMKESLNLEGGNIFIHDYFGMFLAVVCNVVNCYM